MPALSMQGTKKTILPTAEWYAKQRAILNEQGKMPAYADGEIAAIAAANNLTLVTRNIDDFSEFKNLELDNWFE